MTSPDLDPACLARARAGDARAFRALYDHHVDPVFRFVARMLRDRTAAEDAVQEVFVRVFSALPRFDPAGPARLSTWIFTIARRVALTAIQRAHDRGVQQQSLPTPAPPGVDDAPDLRLILEAAIAALPASMRSTFVLRECCQLSYDEVAVIEGVDLGTVKSRLHRARATLQASLANDQDNDDCADPIMTPDLDPDLASERHRHEVRAAKA
jgi:RNA polymerase sigma-70 factor (ECF subfamily)